MRAFEIIDEVFSSNAPCGPLAIRRITSADDETIDKLVRQHGWSERCGISMLQALTIFQELGYVGNERFDLQFKEVRDKTFPNIMSKKPRTLNELLKIIPNGNFYITVKRHAIAIVDGKIFDEARTGLKHQVRTMMEITKKQ